MATTMSERPAPRADKNQAEKPMDAECLIQAARALSPAIEAARKDIEQQRGLPGSLVDAMGAAGMFSLWLPKALGGPALHPNDFIRVIEALSRADGSAGWCASIAGAYSALAGYLQPDVARRLYGGGRTVVAGHTNPTGKAVIADGGYRVTGHWAYGSGIGNSTWTIGNCVVHDRDGVRVRQDGAREIRMMLFPTSAAEQIDTWSVGGLRGTGSHDYRVADLFVSNEYTIGFPDPHPLSAGTVYEMPLISLLAVAIAAVPLGIARAAIDTVIALASTKMPQGSSGLLRDKPTVQADVARAEILLGSARSYLFDTIGEMWDVVATGAAIQVRQRAMVRLACVNAAQASAAAVDLMYNVAGGSALYEVNRLERCFRDVHACTQHIATATSNYETAGRVLLGLDLGTARL